jgi:Tfp pilus assembly protein PilF
MKILKISLTIIVALLFGLSVFVVGGYLYCATVAACDPVRPTILPEEIATQTAKQYELALQDMDAGRYELAKQRLEYVLDKNQAYSNATEKLLEVKRFLCITPTP